MDFTREHAAALTRVLFAALTGPNPPSMEDLTTVQVMADDIEASHDAYEVWLSEREPPVDTPGVPF